MKDNNKNIEYLKARPEDEQAIRNILKILDGDSSNIDLGRFIVARDGEKVIGCIRIKAMIGGTLELSSLAVLHKYQNKGIGSELVKNLLLIEKERPIFLLTSSDKEIFYKKFGFYLTEPDLLPIEFKNEYMRIIGLPFAKNIKVIAMRV